MVQVLHCWVRLIHLIQTLVKLNFFVGLSNTIKALHHVLKQTYCAESLGKWKNLNPLCPLDDMHPEAEHVLVFPIYPARNNTKIITQHSTLRASTNLL
jgi:hypothetical protein